MIREKTKYYTDIQVLGGNTIRICNRNKGSFLFSGTPQIQIIDEDDFQMHTNLSDEQIDEIVEVLQMSQTQNQSKYYYSPRFRHFNIYRRDPDGDTKVDDAATQEEAKRKVYELNGWNYKPKNNTVK